MIRVRIRDLALVAVAGGLLAFEAVSLMAALPAASRALADQGVLGEVKAASMRAAVSTASMLDGAGRVVSRAAVGAVKGAARLLGTVALPSQATGRALATGREHARSRLPHVCVITVTTDGYRTVHAGPSSPRRAATFRRPVKTAPRQATL